MKPLVRAGLWMVGGLVVIAIVAALGALYLGSGTMGLVVVLAGTLGTKVVSEYKKARATEPGDSAST